MRNYLSRYFKSVCVCVCCNADFFLLLKMEYITDKHTQNKDSVHEAIICLQDLLHNSKLEIITFSLNKICIR